MLKRNTDLKKETQIIALYLYFLWVRIEGTNLLRVKEKKNFAREVSGTISPN